MSAGASRTAVLDWIRLVGYCAGIAARDKPMARRRSSSPACLHPPGKTSALWSISILVLCMALPVRAGDFESAEALGAQGAHASALVLYRKAAARGHPLANHRAGTYYIEGIGTDQNAVEAARYFLAGARAGVEDSMVYLARLYLLGKGLPRDCERARYWITRATRGKLPGEWKIELDACS